MPRKRLTGKTRTPTDFRAIGKGERVRWGLGQVLVDGECSPARECEESTQTVTVWPSWQAWAETYALCRPAYLAWFADRFPTREPGAELLFAAYQRGEDPGAVIIPRGPDPRLLLAVP